MLTFSQWTVYPCTVYGSTNSIFSNFFIKNGSHDTIHIFKNYFGTMFSVFNFQFQQNKFYPNRPLVSVWITRLHLAFFFFSTHEQYNHMKQRQKLLFMHCSSTVHVFKNIKNGSHDTIHTFKNYFATVFLIFSFSNNKFNSNGS